MLETTEGALILLSLDLQGGRGGGSSIEASGMGGTRSGLGLIAASVVEEVA